MEIMEILKIILLVLLVIPVVIISFNLTMKLIDEFIERARRNQ